MTDKALSVIQPNSPLAQLDETKQQMLAQLPPAQLTIISRLNPEILTALDPADFQDYIAAALTGAEADQETPYLPEVWKPIHASQLWQDDAGEVLGREIEGVIVYHHPTRAVFIDGEKLPLCSSLDGKTGNARPDAGPEFPWAANSGGTRACAGCPFDEFGSAIIGEGKRCKEKERLFYLPADRSLPVLINVPVKSLGNWRRFTSSLKNQKELTTASMVRSKIKLAKGENPGQVFSIMEFSTAGRLPPQDFLAINRMSKSIIQAARRLGVEVGETYEESPPPQDGDVGF